MSKKRYSKTFGTDDANAFGKMFAKESWNAAKVAKQHSDITLGPVELGGIPVFVYELVEGKKKAYFKLTDVIFDDTEKSYIDPKKSVSVMGLAGDIDEACINTEKSETEQAYAAHSDKLEKLVELQQRVVGREVTRAFVGYDIEYLVIEPSDVDQPTDAELISHQFYVAHNDQRVGIIILTNRRFSEKGFAVLVANLIPKHIKKVFVVAHYSLIEGGWMTDQLSDHRNVQSGQGKSVKHLVEDAKSPRTSIVLDVEDDIVKRVINIVFDEHKKDSKDQLKCDSSLDRLINVTSSHAQLNSFAIEALTTRFKTAKDAYKAVRGGYATYKLSAEDKVQAIRISDVLRDRYRESSREAGIKKYKRTWAGEYRVLSESKRENLRKHINAYSQDWRTEFSKLSELSLEETVLLSFLERNDIRGLNNDLNAVKLWKSAAGVRAGKKTDDDKAYNLRCEKSVERNNPISIEFCDTMHFSTDEGKSLKSFGKMIGIPKLDLDKEDDADNSYIADMQKLLEDDRERFLRYGIRDSVVTAESLAYFGQLFLFELDAPFATRITGYSRDVFREVLSGTDGRYEQGVYEKLLKQAKKGTPEANIKHYLGFSRKKKADGSGNYWWPSVGAQLYSQFYFGGWNDCRVVGAYDSCTYWDLKSAYPCGILMLSGDYSFAHPVVYRGDEAQKRANELFADGEGSPFQIAGVEISFEFLPGKEPIFPVRFDRTRVPNLSLIEFSEQLLYTQRGHTSIGWPEYFVARKYGLLDEKKTSIKKLVTYESISDDSIFAKEIEHLLRMRGELGKKMVFKETLNFLYGLTAMGLDRKITLNSRGMSESKTKPGGLTCIPMAAYCTSFCRAVMGELLACGNKAYAITTDGFISPENNELKRGVLAKMTNDKLKKLTRISDGSSLNYEFIEPDFRADRALFLKTRGYFLEGRENGDDPTVKKVKMAKMGVQTQSEAPSDDELYDPRAREFLVHLDNGIYDKQCWNGFAQIKKDGRNELPLPVVRKARLSHTYDFKRIIAGDVSESTFSYAGYEFKHPKFETEPLPDIDAFMALRTEMVRNSTVEEYQEMIAAVKKSGYVY